jgi:hypothetical protein
MAMTMNSRASTGSSFLQDKPKRRPASPRQPGKPAKTPPSGLFRGHPVQSH